VIVIQPCPSQPAGQAQFDELYRRARECLHRGKFETALRLGEQCLSGARGAGDRRQEGVGHALMGNAYFYTDRYLDALNSFQAGLVLMREAGDQSGEATGLKDVGITLSRFGRFDESFESLHESLNIFRKLSESREIGSVLENIGMDYANLGAVDLAFDMYEQAFEIARENRNAQLMFGSLSRMGELYLSANPGRSLEYFREALAIAEERSMSPIDRGWVLMNTSIALSELGQVEAATAMNRRALTLSRQIGWKGGTALSLQGLAQLYLGRDPAVAVKYYQQSIAILEQIDSGNPWRAYAYLAAAHRRQGDLDRAIECYQHAIDLLESSRDRLTAGEHRATSIERRQFIFHGMIEALMERHERNPEAGDDVRAFAIYERGKARALLAAIAEGRLDIERDLEPDLRGRQAELNARITELHRQLIAPDVTAEERRQLLERLRETEAESDQLIVEIKRQNPRYAMLRYPRPLSLDEAQALLDESTALLAYSITEDKVFAFLLTTGAFRAERLAVSPKLVTTRVPSYVDLVAQGDGDSWQDASLRLYADLVAPLRKHLPPGIKRLILVPDGVLHHLPFETLRFVGEDSMGPDNEAADRRARFLLEDFVISYAPSATVLAELSASRKEWYAMARADLLMLAYPAIVTGPQAHSVPHRASDFTRALYDDEGLEVAPIPFSASEAKNIERYAAAGSEVYTGAQASERRIKSTRLDTFCVIHFATHGLISQRRPARSALVLASGDGDDEDGFLQAREICRLKLKSDLVVLSACQTARGQILGGEGAQGLAQAFFYAGAQSVVASLWNVSDEGTAEFMGRFYRHLSEGRPKAEALRAAKLELMRESSFSAARYWATFILIGEPQERVSISGQPLWLRYDHWLQIGGALILLFAALFLLKGINQGRFRRR